MKSDGKIAEAAGAGGNTAVPGPIIAAVSQTDLVQPQKPQKIPNIVQIIIQQLG